MKEETIINNNKEENIKKEKLKNLEALDQEIVKGRIDPERENLRQMHLAHAFELIAEAIRFDIFHLNDNKNNKFKLLSYGALALGAIYLSPIAQCRAIAYMLPNIAIILFLSANKKIKAAIVIGLFAFFFNQIPAIFFGTMLMGGISQALIYYAGLIEILKYSDKSNWKNWLIAVGAMAITAVGGLTLATAICAFQGLATKVAVAAIAPIFIYKLIRSKYGKIISLGFISALFKALSAIFAATSMFLMTYNAKSLAQAVGGIPYFKEITLLLFGLYLSIFKRTEIKKALFNARAMLKLAVLAAIVSASVALFGSLQAASMFIYLPTIISMIANFNISNIDFKNRTNQAIIIAPAVICLIVTSLLPSSVPMMAMSTLAILFKTLQHLNNYKKAEQDANISKTIFRFALDIIATISNMFIFYCCEELFVDSISYDYKNDLANVTFNKSSAAIEESMTSNVFLPMLFAFQCALSAIKDALSPKSIDDEQRQIGARY